MNLYFRGQLRIAPDALLVHRVQHRGLLLSRCSVSRGLLSLIPYFAPAERSPVMLSAQGLLALDRHGAFWPPMAGALVVCGAGAGRTGPRPHPTKNTGLRPGTSCWRSRSGVRCSA